MNFELLNQIPDYDWGMGCTRPDPSKQEWFVVSTMWSNGLCWNILLAGPFKTKPECDVARDAVFELRQLTKRLTS